MASVSGRRRDAEDRRRAARPPQPRGPRRSRSGRTRSEQPAEGDERALARTASNGPPACDGTERRHRQLALATEVPQDERRRQAEAERRQRTYGEPCSAPRPDGITPSTVPPLIRPNCRPRATSVGARWPARHGTGVPNAAGSGLSCEGDPRPRRGGAGRCRSSPRPSTSPTRPQPPPTARRRAATPRPHPRRTVRSPRTPARSRSSAVRKFAADARGRQGPRRSARATTPPSRPSAGPPIGHRPTLPRWASPWRAWIGRSGSSMTIAGSRVT